MGANIEARTTANGFTPLLCAVLAEMVAAVEVLAKRGANVNVSDSTMGLSALQCAASNNNPEMVRTLVRLGAQST